MFLGLLFLFHVCFFFSSLLGGDTLHLARCMAARVAFEDGALYLNTIDLH
jgi:hypothetical protein